jgi:hypothetical protein
MLAAQQPMCLLTNVSSWPKAELKQPGLSATMQRLDDSWPD